MIKSFLCDACSWIYKTLHNLIFYFKIILCFYRFRLYSLHSLILHCIFFHPIHSHEPWSATISRSHWLHDCDFLSWFNHIPSTITDFDYNNVYSTELILYMLRFHALLERFSVVSLSKVDEGDLFYLTRIHASDLYVCTGIISILYSLTLVLFKQVLNKYL